MPSRVMNVTPLGACQELLVQVIDTYTSNDVLALAFECRVGRGKLLVCSVNVRDNLDDRPAARQFLRSMLGYMASSAFNPGNHLDAASLEAWFEG